MKTKPESINMIELASLIACGAAKAETAERLLEPGNDDALRAYMKNAQRRRNKDFVESCNSEFARAQARLSTEFQDLQIGRKTVLAICRSSETKEAAMAQLREVQQFFRDYGLTHQANQAWKEY